MSSPKVSLLVPIYNVEHYLDQCLESVRIQTLHDIEVICINDGSTDGSPAIIERFVHDDPRFRVINKENSGYGASMNMALDAARGEYIGILESDDYLEPDALERLVATAETFDVPVVKANFWFYWSEPVEKNEVFDFVDHEIAGRVVDPHVVTDFFYRKPSIWSAVYRRSFLADNGIRFLETPGASFQDSAFNFKVWASARRVVGIDTPVIHYRQDNESSSVNSPSKVYCICEEHDEMHRFLLGRSDFDELKPIQEKMKYDNYMWNYDRLSEPLKREFIQRIADEFRDDIEAGYVDLNLFEPWKRRDLQLIMDSPLSFHASRELAKAKKPSVLEKCRRYYQVGGFPLLLEAVKRKLSR